VPHPRCRAEPVERRYRLPVKRARFMEIGRHEGESQSTPGIPDDPNFPGLGEWGHLNSIEKSKEMVYFMDDLVEEGEVQT
jgi:hypothetical protein